MPTAIAIHGGAGTILKKNMTPEREAAIRKTLDDALEAAHSILSMGASSLDAVAAAIQVLEESPLFNAGVGAVFTNQRSVELDASIMDGREHRAGSVAAIKRVKSPILLARAVMEKSFHVMLVGDGAEQFASDNGLEMVENEYFFTERRLRQLERMQEKEHAGLDAAVLGSEDTVEGVDDKKFGTVGAVALDEDGNLAAGTSTGGMTNKRYGRVGDSPIIGAGTYADNESCAVSATGHGEHFIRGAVAHEVSALMRHGKRSLSESANAVIFEQLDSNTGGIISIDREGNISMPFNTAGMYRGYVDVHGQRYVGIYEDA